MLFQHSAPQWKAGVYGGALGKLEQTKQWGFYGGLLCVGSNCGGLCASIGAVNVGLKRKVGYYGSLMLRLHGGSLVHGGL